MNVFVLATCRNPELAPMTELVFKTIRTGFPTARITVSINGDCEKHCPNIKYVAELARCIVVDEPETIHHRWIEDLIESEQEPFYVLDTDVIFYENFERFDFSGSTLAGYRIQEFQDEFTGAITRSRLHTSLLYLDPVRVRAQLEKYESQFPVTPFNPLANPCYPLCLPFNGKGYFYDTCSMLYHAIGGTEFKPEHKNACFHFHYGSLADLVLPRLSNSEGIARVRDEILKNPELGRGLWRVQDEYLASRCPFLDGRDVIVPVTPEESADARHWKNELCKGNLEAMTFCDVWYGYCHGIDDNIDSMQDGRPVMSKRQTIGLFFHAAILYNLPFYKQHQALLFPIILDITNLYSISVEWEVSPKQHLRTMADVFRTSGNRMYSMIALICGGPEHMMNISMRIHERDWLGQHDSNGEPI
jgi:hypothetical protein